MYNRNDQNFNALTFFVIKHIVRIVAHRRIHIHWLDILLFCSINNGPTAFAASFWRRAHALVAFAFSIFSRSAHQIYTNKQNSQKNSIVYSAAHTELHLFDVVNETVAN